MNKVNEKNPWVIIESRKQKIVSCPNCWTDQLANRNFCYCCGATFIFLEDRNTAKSDAQSKSCKC